MSDPLSKPGTEITSGVKTEPLLEGDPPAFWVNWIEWDSDFRRELRVNDLIVGINGQSLAPLLQPQKTFKGIGQYAEAQYWTEIGAKAGDEVALSILRDGEPLVVKGHLGTEMFYFDREGKSAHGPGGPPRLAKGKTVSSWSSWQEKLQWELSYLQTRGWTQKIPTRPRLAGLLEQKEEIDYALATWPGPLAEALRDDWAATVELMRGKKADPPVDLEYRSLGEKRIAIAKTEAAKGWSALLEETAKERIDPFPAASPLARANAVGKLIELPALTPRRMLSDLGKSFAAFGSSRDGWWFLLLDRPELQRFWEVLYRYKGRVNPRLPERYRVLARIRDEAQMLTVDGRPAMGLAVEAVAVLAGEDELLVDLRPAQATFAGESALGALEQQPRDDSSPASVMSAWVTAIKSGDEETFRSLFASWRVVPGSGGRDILDMSYMSYPSALMSEWERSRGLIMGEVQDARVAKVEKVRRILSRSPETGLPDVDQVVVWLDHYGLFDGESRTYQSVNINRRWVLQRLDNGPWRITSVQDL